MPKGLFDDEIEQMQKILRDSSDNRTRASVLQQLVKLKKENIEVEEVSLQPKWRDILEMLWNVSLRYPKLKDCYEDLMILTADRKIRAKEVQSA